MSTKLVILVFGIAIIFTGCDAYKVVRIVNKSSDKIELLTDFPQTTIFIKDSTGKFNENIVLIEDIHIIREKYKNIQIDTTFQGLIIKLDPFQTFEIAGNMGSGFSKIQPRDLNFSRLTIFTINDTIKALNKQEILELLDDDRTKYMKALDNKDFGYSNKYKRYIIIRQ